jgi:hypothetical protein
MPEQEFFNPPDFQMDVWVVDGNNSPGMLWGDHDIGFLWL